MEQFKNFGKMYVEELKGSLDTLDFEVLEKIVSALLSARENGKQVFIFGNGGSASTASHFVSDLNKGATAGCEPSDKRVLDVKRFRAISLSDNIPGMTAWANDSSYENIFVEQLKNFLDKGDLVIGISGSGNSKNVLNAIEYANKNGAVTIGLTGYDGGKLKKTAEICFVVKSNSMRRIEDIHLVLEHLMTEYIYRKLSSES